MGIQLSSSKPDIKEIYNATPLTKLYFQKIIFIKCAIIHVNMKLVYYYFKINCKYFCNLSVLISNAVNIFITFISKSSLRTSVFFFPELKGVLRSKSFKIFGL